MYTARVTGCDRFDSNMISVCYRNRGYYYNSKFNTISTFVASSSGGFKRVSIKNECIKTAIEKAVELYKDSKNV